MALTIFQTCRYPPPPDDHILLVFRENMQVCGWKVFANVAGLFLSVFFYFFCGTFTTSVGM